MSMRVYSGQLTLDLLRSLLTQVWPSQVEFGLVEKVDDLQLLATRQDAAPDPAQWSQGRVFGPNTEVRWEQRGEKYHVVVADTANQVPIDGLTPAQDDWSGGAQHIRGYYLWHKADMRMQRFLNTDRLGISGRALLDIAEYTDAAGVTRFHRYVGMRAEPAQEADNESV